MVPDCGGGSVAEATCGPDSLAFRSALDGWVGVFSGTVSADICGLPPGGPANASITTTMTRIRVMTSR